MQASLLGAVTNMACHNNLGLVLMPTFTYKNGQLWREEVTALQSLAGSNLNIDHGFSLLFEGKHVADSRPSVYPGRICTGMNSGAITENLKKFWNAIPLFKNGCTRLAKMLKTPEMTRVDDIDLDAPPTTTDADLGVSDSERFSQIGIDACVALLTAVTTNIQPCDRVAMVLYDLSAKTGDMGCAWMDHCLMSQVDWYYYGECADAGLVDFNKAMLVAHATNKYLADELKIVGQPVKPEPPDTVMLPTTRKPVLQAAIWDDNERTIKLPDNKIAEYHDHLELGREFRAFLEEFNPAI